MVGSAIADGALIFLSYLDYRQIAVKEKTGDLVIPTPGK
jgi:hypothetical protein